MRAHRKQKLRKQNKMWLRRAIPCLLSNYFMKENLFISENEKNYIKSNVIWIEATACISITFVTNICLIYANLFSVCFGGLLKPKSCSTHTLWRSNHNFPSFFPFHLVEHDLIVGALHQIECNVYPLFFCVM